ncbi:MAG: UTP--glucose-1-phosphate uridylyltransferase GalU [bacterium]
MPIHKAVFPAAGLGTRFLPATKSSPKEMLPLVDKPMIQYVVEEAIDSGIEDITIVTGRGKRAIEDYFDISFELEHELDKKGKHDLLKQMKDISTMATVSYIRQKEPLGLGHAILVTRNLVGNETFAVLLGDDIIDANPPCLKQLINVYAKFKCSVLAVQRVPKEHISSYGVIKARHLEENVYQVLDLVEKPDADKAPSDLAIIGRYILTPEIFTCLEGTRKDRTGEIQLTNGLRLLLKRQAIFACEFTGERFDAGNKIGFLKATIEFALKRPDLADEFRSYLKEKILGEGGDSRFNQEKSPIKNETPRAHNHPET